MAYNRKNKLKIMQEVIEVYCREMRPGTSSIYVYNAFIKPRFHISLTTLYAYLATPVKRQIKEENQKEKSAKQLLLDLNLPHQEEAT
jgi:hypothetical protein